MSVHEGLSDCFESSRSTGIARLSRGAGATFHDTALTSFSSSDLPDGPFVGPARPALSAKISRFPFDPNHRLISRHPVPDRGTFRDRHGRRVWDAVDAAMRKTKRAGSRTAKPCGPGAPTLALSS